MDAAEVEFRLLGPVEVWVAGRRVEVGAARQRCVLAALMWDVNHCVSADRIVERVWGEQRLPDQPRNTVRTYVSFLRSALAQVDGVTIERRSEGYLVNADARLLDVRRFDSLLDRARSADADGGDRSVALFGEALGLWRGEPFAGLDTPWINAARQSLALRRRAVRLDLTDIQLRSGRHHEVLVGLSAEVAAHPLDERLAGQLMLALYRSSRQAESLAQYQRIRGCLADELGIDPGRPLQQLYQRILAADPSLAAPVPQEQPVVLARPAAVVPRQLPAAPRWFAGRARELGRLTAALDERPDSGRTLAISAIGGVGGIGKTWLALHWAHQHTHRFPDGQLYVDLRGFDPSAQPMPPATAVRGFLEALGVASAAVPVDPHAQVGLYRSLTAERRMLIVLDNARDASQVTPLLPGSPTCTVLVTSRQRLAGLIVAHGAHPVELDLFSRDETLDLLTRYLGAARVVAERDAIGELIERCAGLPLAVSIVAARALAQPELPLSVMAEELRDASARLDALESGDQNIDVRTVFSWSYDALNAEAAEALGLLALAPGPDIGVLAATNLTALPPERLRAALLELQNAHLLQQAAAGRYHLHDLVRLYATERACAEHSPSDRESALRRLLDFHVQTAVAAEHLLDPSHAPVKIDDPIPGSRSQALADETAALAWFEDEHAVLLAVQQFASDQGWHAGAWHLAWTLDAFHWRRGHIADDLAVWQAGLAAADALGDPVIRVRARRRLGHAHLRAGQYAAGTRFIEEGLALAEEVGDLRSQAHNLAVLAWAWELDGDEQRALEHAERAFRIFRSLGAPVWEARTLNDVGWHQARLGMHAPARENCRSALARTRENRDRDGEANALSTLAFIAEQTGEGVSAIELYHQALAVYQELDHTYEQASTLDRIAAALAASGQDDQALHAWHRARRLYESQHRVADAERVRTKVEELRPGLVRRIVTAEAG
jgi:DNA-binding SARP family transcriptional activator/tetratricopeptide (TPR) repeat protein